MLFLTECILHIVTFYSCRNSVYKLPEMAIVRRGDENAACG